VVITKIVDKYYSLLNNTFVKYKSILIYVGVRGFSVLTMLGMSKVLTSLLPQNEYGLYALYTTIWGSLATVFYNPVGQGLIRFFPIITEAGENESLKKVFHFFLNKGLKWSFFTLSIICPIIYIFVGWEWSIMVVMAFTIAFFAGISSMTVGLFNSFDLEKRTTSLFLEFFDKGLLLILCTLGAFILPKSIAIVCTFLISTFIVAFISRILLNRQIFTIENRISNNFEKFKKDIIAYSYPYTIWGITTAIQTSSERWALGLFYSPDKVANYAVINLLGFQSLNILFAMITSFISPLIFQANRNIKSANIIIKKTILLFISITFICASMLYVGGHHAILFISTPKYLIENINFLLFISCVSACIFNIAQVHSLKYMRSLNTKNLIPVHVVSSILGIIFNLLFTYNWGIVGLVFSLLISMILKIVIQVFYWISMNNKS
jgi:O-antigen/teichoic acid export membrane protein